MKWGVWNAETAERYRGGASSMRDAKKKIRQLNKLDKRKAQETGKALDAEKKGIRYLERSQNAKTGERVDELERKGDETLLKSKAHEDAAKGIAKTQSDMVAQLKKDGYPVSMRRVERSTMTKGQTAVEIALNAVAYSTTGTMVYYDRTVPGTKYKFNKKRYDLEQRYKTNKPDVTFL